MDSNIINHLKNLRLNMANKEDTIMHIAVVFGKKMQCLLWGWDK